MILECIKKGFLITHKNWQLILVLLVTAVIGLIGFLVFIGVPFAAAVAKMGIDISRARDILPGIIESPLEFFSEYIKLAVFLFIALFLYLTAASVFSLYVFGGTMGVLRNSVFDAQYKFSLSSFFYEAKELFFPLVWLSSLALSVIIISLVVLLILAGIVNIFVLPYSQPETIFSVFIANFINLLITFSVISICFMGLMYTSYSFVALVVEKTGVRNSLDSAWNLINNKPAAFLLYIILLISIPVILLIVMAFGIFFRMFPLSGYIIIIPYEIMAFVLRFYLVLVAWSSLFVFFIRGINSPVKTSLR